MTLTILIKPFDNSEKLLFLKCRLFSRCLKIGFALLVSPVVLVQITIPLIGNKTGQYEE